MTAPDPTHMAPLPAREDVPVLSGRPLRPGTDPAATARFSDDTWHLEPAMLQQHSKSVSLHFATVPTRYRHVAKELCYALLSGPLPPGENRQSVIGILAAFKDVRRFLRWLDTCNPQPATVAAVTDADLLAYYRNLLELDMAAGSRENARRAVTLLWRYRDNLSDPLPVNPRHIDGWCYAKARTGENATDRIPERVLGPLLAWALRFVDDFAPDIVAARRARQRYQDGFRNGRYGRNDGLRTDVEAYLHEHVRTGRPLPGHQGHPNIRFISVALGGSSDSLWRDPLLRSMVEDTAAQVGITEHTWLPVQVTGHLDDQPWTEGIALRHPWLSVRRLSQMLQIASYILIAFLSGMRDAEIKHLRRGCLSVHRDLDGIAYRWKVTGRAFKGETDPTGRDAAWVVGQPAARAIAVLEELHTDTDTDLLFPGDRPGKAQSTAVTNTHLARFVDWIDIHCAEHGRSDSIPTIPSCRTALSTRQFRRTLAWFVARRPGGSIAGAIQYRHLSVQMFEGYAGTSDSGFRAEVEAEQALARGEHLLALTDAHDHPALRGPAAAEAQRRLDHLSARFGGAVVTDPQRLKRLMQRHDPAIYPGTYATCVFDPAKALCHPRSDVRGLARPAVDSCQPLACANAALTGDNIAALRAEQHQLAHTLATPPGLPPLLNRRLTERHDLIANFLDRHTDTPEQP